MLRPRVSNNLTGLPACLYSKNSLCICRRAISPSGVNALTGGIIETPRGIGLNACLVIPPYSADNIRWLYESHRLQAAMVL